MKIFNWKDFQQFNVPPETLADYCNFLLMQRSSPIRLCRHWHDIVREDAGFTKEYLEDFPKKGRMITE